MTDYSRTLCSTDHAPWYLVQLRPNCVKKAISNLERQGFAAFCPQQRVTRRARSGFKETIQPLFPGYLFTQVAHESGAWRSINGTYGVSRLVTFGLDYPRPLNPGFIAQLKQRCDEAGILQPPREISAGDRIRVTSGPFADFISTVEKIDSQKRVWILLDLLGQSTRIGLDPKDVTHC
ncbi:hypothetical protein CKO19_16140 [Rhodovulum adriaticum]|nr:hypothetical protein [Rhodovulum adriaticum]